MRRIRSGQELRTARELRRKQQRRPNSIATRDPHRGKSRRSHRAARRQQGTVASSAGEPRCSGAALGDPRHRLLCGVPPRRRPRSNHRHAAQRLHARQRRRDREQNLRGRADVRHQRRVARRHCTRARCDRRRTARGAFVRCRRRQRELLVRGPVRHVPRCTRARLDTRTRAPVLGLRVFRALAALPASARTRHGRRRHGRDPAAPRSGGHERRRVHDQPRQRQARRAGAERRLRARRRTRVGRRRR
ncbi:hypothetical protein QFZ91_000517 [Paraburkholderia sp. JPY419]